VQQRARWSPLRRARSISTRKERCKQHDDNGGVLSAAARFHVSTGDCPRCMSSIWATLRCCELLLHQLLVERRASRLCYGAQYEKPRPDGDRGDQPIVQRRAVFAGEAAGAVFVDGVGPWLWPEADDWGFLSPARDWFALRDLVCLHTPRRRVIVQAGGCCGVFEPDPLNFFCLAQN
jgi:hypothetical protein